MRRTTVLGSAGTLIAGTLLAGAIAAPIANADGGHAAATAASGSAAREAAREAARDAAKNAAAAAGTAIAAARAAKQGVDWRDCPADWALEKPIQCGWVKVPLDYTKPLGKQIEIAVDRIGSTGTKGERQGSLVYNPGGPGGSGLAFPRRVVTNNAIWADAAKAYDFVGFDPRGVGHSAPISCVDPQEFVKAPKADPVPDSEADKRAQRKLAAEYAAGCKERSGEMLPHMTTPNTARDLDVVRAALGDKKLNYVGVSYGTYLGAVYGTLFPTHVRRMVVDSVVNPSKEKIWYQANLDQDIAFETRFQDWLTWVAKNDAAFHLGDTEAKVAEQWETLRAAAKKAPLGGVVGPAELLDVFTSAPYYDSAWVSTATLWSKYVAGDTQPLIDAGSPDLSDTAGNAKSENGNAVYTAVECTDAKWPADWKTWDRDTTRIHRDHPFLTWSNTWMNLPCATWGVKQQTPVEVKTGKGLPPVLITQSTRDAATPYAGAVELHQRFKGSRLITEKDAGSHGITNLVNPCVNDRVKAYLLTGALDSADVTCAPHATPKP
ncbi:alpha/beta hydrolase [Streptomyces corynorhini]|uniref:Alpha/beta hydrolase n=1 Tax=Streptomyces corynorhini TaxID=2282652 RepID=A0A370B4M4_9ACTN|nr:alpha/beta hydrolase [Streptomyces corynorhini]RDG34813.1 alpha/beta hydrolase [Streptomyces corynorhini]